MSVLRFPGDMNVSPKTIEILRGNGWDIVRVSQFLPWNAPDNELLDFARREGRVLVTQDLDFSNQILAQN